MEIWGSVGDDAIRVSTVRFAMRWVRGDGFGCFVQLAAQVALGRNPSVAYGEENAVGSPELIANRHDTSVRHCAGNIVGEFERVLDAE